jgi:3-hydroxyisobutyrate dehydrogenase-like beta-hydroxyacid dehydrogenase
MKKVGFIGLGVMGSNMAKNLINHVDQLNIISRNSKKTFNFTSKLKKNKKLKIFDKLEDLAKQSNIIISCVGNDRDLKDIFLTKKGIINYVSKNTVIIDHTTASAEITEVLYKKFLIKKCFFYDAPVSGGEIGAINGTLSIMVGGNKKKINLIKNIVSNYSKSIVYMGKSGNGQLTKMVNQICVASIIQGLAEGLFFAKKKKLNVDNLMKVIGNGAGQSWQFDNRTKTMWDNKFNFGFMNKLMLKDLKIILKETKNVNINLPITKIIKGYYSNLVRKGYSHEDTSNLIRLLNKN